MKKLSGTLVGIVVAGVLAVAIIPTSRDEIHWRWTSHMDRTTNYESYLNAWPAGRHVVEAQKRSDEHRWADADSGRTVQGFERYIQLHADGRHIAEAKDRIETLRWQEASTANTVEGFQRYIQSHGDGKHVGEAKNNIEALRWQEATTANNVQGFERYVELYGEGKHVAEAKGNIESLHWQEATTANTIKSYRGYCSSYPQGRHVEEAEATTTVLRTDDAPFDVAWKKGTEDSLKCFLEDFPGHRKQADAQQALKDIAEGRDIVDLIHEKKVEVQPQGSGIERVAVRLRKLVPYSLTVRIPVGTFFVSNNSSAQNMVTTAETKVRLTSDDWRTVSPDVACANRPRDIPGTGDTFTVQRSPHQEELARLIPVLDKAGVGYATRQAAVWIVTDNADYEDLGTLVTQVSTFGGFQPFGGGTRTIREGDAARAMKICHDAGIDIAVKAIWRDRSTIRKALPEGELKKWLEATP